MAPEVRLAANDRTLGAPPPCLSAILAQATAPARRLQAMTAIGGLPWPERAEPAYKLS